MAQKVEVAWKALNGLICLYKPAEASCDYVKNKIISNLCNELNKLETRSPSNYLDIKQVGTEISINVRPSYADHVLCVGPRYQPEDFVARFPSYLGRKVSGVLLLGINGGEKLAGVLKKCFLPKCYNVKGILGQATTNFHVDERVIARAKFERIEKSLIDKTLAAFQAAYQKRMFKEHVFNLHSQEAYELAVAGLYRPVEKKTPVIYSVKCIDFQSPYFTLEINCINENEAALMELVHNIGVSLKCYATCTGLQCIRHGFFTVQHALLKKHWQMEHILDNMNLSWNLIEKYFPQTIGYTPTIKLSTIKT